MQMGKNGTAAAVAAAASTALARNCDPLCSFFSVRMQLLAARTRSGSYQTWYGAGAGSVSGCYLFPVRAGARVIKTFTHK